MEVNYKTINYLHGLYMCGMSLAKLSQNYAPEISRQRLHYYFQAYNLPTRAKKFKDYRIYNGKKYTQGKDGYWRKTDGDRMPLHRQVWLDMGNEIPDGWAVIFRDRNIDNTEYSNLACVPLQEFGEIYSTGENQYTKRRA